ncbi:MAG: AAA family ATPase [Desulfobacterales bacterium]
MYLAHYELQEKPFKLTTDPRFLWLGPEHAEALATLRYGVLENKGLLLLTGDIGTGKTTLVSALVDRLDTDRVVSAALPDPGLSRREFFYLVARQFGLSGPVHDKETFTDAFGEFLDHICRRNKKALLIIDEIQVANNRVLEEIRLLSNLEYRHVKPLNIFLVGQNEFNQKLLEPAHRAIKERIAVNYNLKPLTAAETAAYIIHRLRVAGARRRIFTDEAVQEIQAFSGGAPRRINIICDLALVRGYAEDTSVLDRRVILGCEQRLVIDGPAPEAGPESQPESQPETKIDADRPSATGLPPEAAAADVTTAVRPLAKSTSRIRRYAVMALVIFLPAIFILYALWSSGLIKRNLSALSAILPDRLQATRDGDPAPLSSTTAPNHGENHALPTTLSPASAPAGGVSSAVDTPPRPSSPRAVTTGAKAPPRPPDRQPGHLNLPLSRLEPESKGTAMADKPAGPGQKVTGMAPGTSPQPGERLGRPVPAPRSPEKNAPATSDNRAAVGLKGASLLPSTPPGPDKSAPNPSGTANQDTSDIIKWLLEKKKAESAPDR